MCGKSWSINIVEVAFRCIRYLVEVKSSINRQQETCRGKMFVCMNVPVWLNVEYIVEVAFRCIRYLVPAFFFIRTHYIRIIRLRSGKNKNNLRIIKAQILP